MGETGVGMYSKWGINDTLFRKIRKKKKKQKQRKNRIHLVMIVLSHI